MKRRNFVISLASVICTPVTVIATPPAKPQLMVGDMDVNSMYMDHFHDLKNTLVREVFFPTILINGSDFKKATR